MQKLLYVGLLFVPLLASAQKITLTPAMLISENAFADPGGEETKLIDEQGAGVDPKNGQGNSPVTAWFPGWDSTRYPASVIIDLRAEYNLTHVYLYDSNGSGDFVVEAGPPFAWSQLFRYDMGAFNQWIARTVSVRTRYLRLTATVPGGSIPREVILYGTIVAGQTPQPDPAPTPHLRPTVDQLIGTNAFIDDPLGLMEAAGGIREYHNWAWDEGDSLPGYPGYPGNQNAWNPAWGGGGAWDFDAYYRNLTRLGLHVSPCIQGSVTWVLGAGANLEHKPIPQNSGGLLLRDAQQPASYVEHADHLFQYAARFGLTSTPSALLKLRADQPLRSGLGVLRFFENWNEPDKTWHGRQGRFNPFEYAAMSSADLDGHQGTLGTTVGVRAADPQARLAMAGLTSFDLPYLRALKFWSDHKRGGDFPFSALNFHHYSTDGGGQGGTSTKGVSPETDNLRQRLQAVRDYRDRHLPGRELWVSEFGYDRASGSDFRAPPIGAQSASETQARWIVRSWLALAAAGVDRGFQFMLRDVSAVGAADYNGRFNTCGLVGPKNDWTPRPAWFYQVTLRQRLRGLRYLDDLAISTPNILAYRFANDAGQPRAIVVWRSTETDTTSANVSVPLPANTTRVTRVEFTPGDIHGTLSELIPASGAVTLTVTEKPTILLLNGRNTAARPLDRLLRPTAAQVTNETASGDAALLFDEPSLIGDPDMGKPAATKPVRAWSPGQGASYPVSAYIDLGVCRRVKKIYLHDFNSTGDFILSRGGPGAWTEFSRDGLNSFAAWRAHVPPGPARHLRFTMATAGANVAEVALYAESTSGYVDWSERRFPLVDPAATGAAAPSADPDGDGVSNLLEYALGGDPNAAEGDLLPSARTENGRLVIDYVRDLWLTDVSYQVEWSHDLLAWTTTGVEDQIVLATADIERRHAGIVIPASGKAFARLRVSLLGAPDSSSSTGPITSQPPL